MKVAWLAALLALIGLAVGIATAQDDIDGLSDSALGPAVGKRMSVRSGYRADNEPLVRLPPGVRIDPSTGFLVGVQLDAEDGVSPLPWELLRSYVYEPGLENLPEAIRALDGKRVVMLGFLAPRYEVEDIRDFVLVASHWSCCYGVPPGLDGAVRVRLDPKQEGLPNTIKPIRVIGTLRVKEIREEESDIVWAIYSMDDAEAVILSY